MGIKEFIEEMNKKSRYKWERREEPTADETRDLFYEIRSDNGIGLRYHFKVSEESLRTLDFYNIYHHLEAEMIEHEQIWLYKMFEKMTPSMKKALVDIMQVQIKENFDELNNIGDRK